MAIMVLNRLPTDVELKTAGMEAHTFLDAFHKYSVSGFSARVELDGDFAILDGWALRKAEWFECVEVK